MFVIVPAIIRLHANDLLRYNCPIGSTEDYQSDQFFQKYRGKLASYVGPVEDLIGPLDFRGRMPGRYLDHKHIKVRFEGEDNEHMLQAHHFVLLHPREHHVLPQDYNLEAQRIGDLLHEILFYPDDEVRYTDTKDLFSADVRKVSCVFVGDARFAPNGVPRYHVLETAAEQSLRKAKGSGSHFPSFMEEGKNCAGDEIELVARGNVWALYNDSSKLSFKSANDEAEFWARDGMCSYVSDEVKRRQLGISERSLSQTFRLSLKKAYLLFERGAADVIVRTHSNPSEGPRYQVKVLHDCFAQHRQRVRAITEELWAAEAKKEAVA